MRILLDTNVVVDVLQHREPWFQSSVEIIRAVASRQIVGCLTAKQIADVYFFSRKQFKGEEEVDVKARQVVKKILSLFTLIDTLDIDCLNALGIKNGDYEDALLVASAVRSDIDGIVTRNPNHFRNVSIAIYSPDQLLAILDRTK